MNFTLKDEKIKSFGFLLNSVREKNRELNIPYNCFFIGAGCSKSSGIPLGGEIIDICRKFSFIKQHEDSILFEKERKENFYKYYDRANSFVNERKDEYEKFVSEKENEFLRNINKENVLAGIPDYVKDIVCKTAGKVKDEADDFLFEEFKDNFYHDSLYGNWFEQYSGDKRERQMLIEDIIEDKNPNGAFILFANFIQHGIIHNVFTTNFDDLLNEALMKYMDKKARVYSHNELADFISITSTKPNIIKLHGDYLFENIQNSGEETSRLNPNMEIKMKEALGKLGLIVIGYSGADNSIMSVLEEIKIKNKKEFLLIWCAKNSDNLHWRVVNLINETQNSFLVQIDDFDTLVGKLFVKFRKPINDIAETAMQKKSDLDKFINKFKNEFIRKEDITAEEIIEFDNLSKAEKYFNLGFGSVNHKTKIDFYNRAIELYPEYALAYHNRAIAYGELKENEMALSDYEKAIEFNPEYANSYNNRGTIYKEMNDPEKAIRDYNKAIELNPDLANAYNNRGIIYDQLNQNENAMYDYNKAIELNPSNAKAYVNRGNLFYKTGEKEKALFDYSYTIDLNPYYAEAHSNKAFVLEMMNSFTKALEECSKAIEIEPNDAYYYHSRGNVYLKMKDYNSAEKDFQKAYDIQPGNISILNSLSGLFLIKSNAVKALETLNKYDENILYGKTFNAEKEELLLYYFLKCISQKIVSTDYTDSEIKMTELLKHVNSDNAIISFIGESVRSDNTLSPEIKTFILEKINSVRNKI